MKGFQSLLKGCFNVGSGDPDRETGLDALIFFPDNGIFDDGNEDFNV